MKTRPPAVIGSAELAEPNRPADHAKVEVDCIERPPGRLHGGVALGVEEAVVAEMRAGPPGARGLASGVGLGLVAHVGAAAICSSLAQERERRHDRLAFVRAKALGRRLLLRDARERRELPVRGARARGAVAHRAVLRVRPRAGVSAPGGGSSRISRIHGISFAFT